MERCEVELKSLLGSREAADALRARMHTVDPAHMRIGGSVQLNHYFMGGNVRALYESVRDTLTDHERERLSSIAHEGRNVSVRTRRADETVLLVLKASVDDTTSENGIARLEFEAETGDSLSELDRRVQSAGYTYQAKWSREREEYVLRESTLTIDKNAGYGYLAELERIVEDPADAPRAQHELRALMAELGLEELSQDRLERMFSYYNTHWPEYYGTEKTFTIM